MFKETLSYIGMKNGLAVYILFPGLRLSTFFIPAKSNGLQWVLSAILICSISYFLASYLSLKLGLLKLMLAYIFDNPYMEPLHMLKLKNMSYFDFIVWSIGSQAIRPFLFSVSNLKLILDLVNVGLMPHPSQVTTYTDISNMIGDM